MKIYKIFAISAIVAVAMACGQTPEGSKEVRELLPTRTEVDSASYLLGANFGFMIKNYGFGKLNYSELLKGMKDAANSKGDPQDSTFVDQFKISPEEMGRILDGHLEKMSAYKAALNDEKGQAFIQEYLKNDGAQVTETGIAYTILEAGEELHATSLQDTVKVSYVGTLIDGTEFDNGQDIEFPLNRVIAGWGEGMQLVGKGGKIELVIPGALAYGERGSRGIEPNSTLKFVVDLIDVMPYVEPVEEEAPAAPARRR
jgi:FKBP-type peptidyl-prolyl cis-trans isomerase